MAVVTACYCTREDVKRSVDIKDTARNNWQIDQAIQSASRNIEHHMHRVFYPSIATHYWDWPNYQYAFPWRIWFDQFELADVTVNPPVVMSGTQVLTAGNLFWGPWNDSPPYTYIEINRSTNTAFGVSTTPQRDVSITGTFGYNIESDPGGTLAAAISSTSATTITVSSAATSNVGTLLLVDSERMLVSDVATTSTGQVNLSGATTASASDNAITVTSGAAINVNEVLSIDSEKMLAVDITGNTVTVVRAWDGTVLATHSTSTAIYAYRSLTVARGFAGTTAATHSNSAPISVHRVPALIHDLAVAEASNTVLQRTSGYAEVGAAGYSLPNATLGAGLADLWDEAETSHGRKSRRRVI